MASILNVDQIGHSTSGTTAITIASDGTVTMPENDSGWITATLNSPYTHFTSPYGDVQYRKTGNIVNIQGLVNANSATNGSTIFTLPSGYRPSLRLVFAQPTANTSITRLDVDTNGDVIAHIMTNNTSWTSLAITFMVA